MKRDRRSDRRRRTIAQRQSYIPKGQPRAGPEYRLVSLGALFLVILLGVGYLLFLSPLFAVRTVAVKQAGGTVPVDKIQETVRQAAVQRIGSIETASLVSVNTGQVEQAIENAYPSVASAHVVIKWPNSLQVTIEERRTSLVWRSGDKTYLIDQSGVAYAPGEPRPDVITVEDTSNVPVDIGKPVVGNAFIKVLTEIQRGMQAGNLRVTSFRVPETTFEVQAATDQGFYALFDTTRPVGSQVQALLSALKTGKPAQYADLRVPGRVYLK